MVLIRGSDSRAHVALSAEGEAPAASRGLHRVSPASRLSGMNIDWVIPARHTEIHDNLATIVGGGIDRQAVPSSRPSSA